MVSSDEQMLHPPSLRAPAKQSSHRRDGEILDCFVAFTPRNDGGCTGHARHDGHISARFRTRFVPQTLKKQGSEAKKRKKPREKLCRSLSTSTRSVIIERVRIRGDTMATQMSKSQLVEKIATTTELSKRDVKNVMDTLTDVGHKELKKSGVFLLPGWAKFVVVKKPATKARKGTNPFTGEEMMFKAKPARKIVRARPVKAAKDAV
jgi:DNA-binding protein HU-beta